MERRAVFFPTHTVVSSITLAIQEGKALRALPLAELLQVKVPEKIGRIHWTNR
jgi:hypothetical protein